MIRFTDAVRNAQADATIALLDGGPGPAYIELRSGAQPATANDPATGTVLAVWTLQDPSFGPASAGVVTLNVGSGISTTATGTGTATWARAYESDGTPMFDGAVGTAGTDYLMADTVVAAGQTVNLLSGSITFIA